MICKGNEVKVSTSSNETKKPGGYKTQNKL